MRGRYRRFPGRDGLLALTDKRLAAALAIVLLAVVIVGPIAKVATGLHPIDSRKQNLAIILARQALAFSRDTPD